MNADSQEHALQIECGGKALAYLKGDMETEGDLSTETKRVSFSEDGTLSVTLHPGTFFFARVLQQKEPGLYRGNIRVDANHAGLYTLYDVNYAACYKGKEMVSFSNSETIFVPQGCTVKTFRWDAMRPVQ